VLKVVYDNLKDMNKVMDLSIVVPVFNECENIENLIDEINSSISNISAEIIVVDDCSNDNTLDLLKNKKRSTKNLRVVSHEVNYGQSSAIYSGVLIANSEWIATLDGDSQNDPSDIPKLYENIDKDEIIMVAGHRTKRKDSLLKRLSSKYANKVRLYLLNDGVPDTGCGLKIFPKKQFLKLPFFDHMHRYLPALFIATGGKVVSMPVNHRPRQMGYSKYGFNNRFWVGIVDLLGVLWLVRRTKNIKLKEI